ncbi:MAG: potassium-transporting ATPase subunit C [Thaumarchaeota archaeon]|nr:potassium-transporting ATPase subunit C [Nitrososphaerota archaeon]
MKELETTTSGKKAKRALRPIIGLGLLSLLVCGLFFPLFITGLAQVLFPYQANGELVHLKGEVVGSNLIAQNFTLPIFFQPRNESQSASGLDPDITVQMADAQIGRISNATGIPASSLQQVVNENVDVEGRLVELQYVNVLTLNIQLINEYQSVYSAYG